MSRDVERLRAAMKESCDLLAERTHGSPARSPGHNARLCLEAALATPSPPLPESGREVERLRATLLNIQSDAERGFPIDASKLATRCRHALASHAGVSGTVEGEWQDGQHELLGFLAIHADKYQRDYGLNGLHPIHYDLMQRYGAPMSRFKKATNAPAPATDTARQ